MKISDLNERLFIVYSHVNKINGKVYIGITSQIPQNRWRNGEGYINCPIFYRAIKKYSWEGFEHNILYQNLSNNEACEIEAELIYYYKSLGISYNVYDSSDGIGKSSSRKINIYNVNGTFIKSCESIHQAAIEFNTSESGIYYCATKYGGATRWKDFIFLFESESIEDRLNYINTFKREASNKRKIIMNDMEGTPIRTFNSITDAVKFVKGNSAGNIVSCCKGNKNSYMGYKWKYKEDI